MKKKSVDLNTLFIGPKAENNALFLENLIKLSEDHSQWRKNFHPEDGVVITESDKRKDSYLDTKDKMEGVFAELSSKLRATSTPWHSPRYLGHMNTETLIPGLLGYFGAMLYNPNNVAYESSAPTSIMEDEVGADFCKLMGFDIEKGWGHICADGSIANFEGLWYARNIKSLPLAIKAVCPELVKGKTEWELLNMSIDEILDILDSTPNNLDILKNHSARSVSDEIPKLGKWIVPQTKHYSWLKAADVLGVGTDNLIMAEVNSNFKMDIDKLKITLDGLIASKTPILGIVAVVGTTEEGAVDHVDQILALKKEYAKQGINFYFHIDAAYGGYARSIFLDENYDFIKKENLKKIYEEYDTFKDNNIAWPSDDVYNAFKAMSGADSITIDPHKMGYIPYSAGGIVIRDKRMKKAISYFASYVFEKGVKIPALLGAFIMEGSKAGATAAAVWTAHRILPLNVSGYGKLIGASIEGAYNLYNKLQIKKEYVIGNKTVKVEALTKPDFNMVDFVFNVVGNGDLTVMNDINESLYNMSSIMTPNIYSNDFLTSHTDFSTEDYGNAPLDILKRLGIPELEWKKVDKLTLLRACVLSPFMNDINIFNEYLDKVDTSIVNKLTEILKK